jgi:hypothetical protein
MRTLQQDAADKMKRHECNRGGDGQRADPKRTAPKHALSMVERPTIGVDVRGISVGIGFVLFNGAAIDDGDLRPIPKILGDQMSVATNHASRFEPPRHMKRFDHAREQALAPDWRARPVRRDGRAAYPG